MHKYWINYQTLPFTRYDFNTSKKFLTTIFYSPPPFLSLLRPAITSLVRVCTLLDWSKLSNVSACLVFSNSPTPHHHPHSPIPLSNCIRVIYTQPTQPRFVLIFGGVYCLSHQRPLPHLVPVSDFSILAAYSTLQLLHH